MITSYSSENFIVFYLYNFKKTLFDFYIKNSVSNVKNINIVGKNIIKVNFTDNYYFEKENIILFFNDEDINFEIMYVKYKKNCFHYVYFEEVVLNCFESEFDEIENFLVLLNVVTIKKFNQLIFFVFCIHAIIFQFFNLKKCLLFIKQLQK